MNMNEKIKTNADRIRAMTDEELANVAREYICGMVMKNAETCDVYDGERQCRDCCLAWLRSPVEESHE